MDFSIDRWAASAPGLSDTKAWQRWCGDPAPLPDAPPPDLPEIPAMQRRRISALGRHALHALSQVAQAADAGIPRIYASRLGELGRSAELIETLNREGTVSPMSFSLSVHNAIGALSSIARGDPAPYTALAAGEETLEAAFVEAWGLLSTGATRVLIVAYEDAIPAAWAAFDPSPELAFPRAVAFSVRRGEDGAGLTLRCGPSPGGTAAHGAAPSDVHASEAGDPGSEPSTPLPADLAFLRFFATGAASFSRAVGPRSWEWRRRG